MNPKPIGVEINIFASLREAPEHAKVCRTHAKARSHVGHKQYAMRQSARAARSLPPSDENDIHCKCVASFAFSGRCEAGRWLSGFASI